VCVCVCVLFLVVHCKCIRLNMTAKTVDQVIG